MKGSLSGRAAVGGGRSSPAASETVGRMGSRAGHSGKSLSLTRGLLLVFGYFVTSSILGLAVAVCALHALYPAVGEWRCPAVIAAGSMALAIGLYIARGTRWDRRWTR